MQAAKARAMTATFIFFFSDAEGKRKKNTQVVSLRLGSDSREDERLAM